MAIALGGDGDDTPMSDINTTPLARVLEVLAAKIAGRVAGRSSGNCGPGSPGASCESSQAAGSVGTGSVGRRPWPKRMAAMTG